MKISPEIASRITGRKIVRSHPGKLIKDYDKSLLAEDLFRFLLIHSSIRVLFNALIKVEFVSVEKALMPISSLLKNARTALTYVAHCSCSNILEKPHVLDLIEDFNKQESKRITCSKCEKRNELSIENYKAVEFVDVKHLLKPFFHAQKGIFSIALLKECLVCGNQTIEDTMDKKNLKVDLLCNQCDSLTYLSVQVFAHPELNNFIKGAQGYWLEWYVWRIVKEEYSCEVGVKIKKEDIVEVDVVAVVNNKTVFLECKDTHEEDFLKKLHIVNKICDYFVLVSTCSVNNTCLKAAKEILGEKFIYIESYKIENINEIMRQLVK